MWLQLKGIQQVGIIGIETIMEYATSSRGTHRLLLQSIMWGWLALNVRISPPQLHVHVIQDDGGTGQLSSQDRPASDIPVTQDRSTTPFEDQESPTTHQDRPTTHQDSSTTHQDMPTTQQDSPTTHQDSRTTHQDSPTRCQDTTEQDRGPPVPQVSHNLPLYIPSV